MASVEKRYNKSGTLIPFSIYVFHGRDEFGKQLPPFIKTVRVPPELNARQIETLIQRETVHFEDERELITAREKEEAAKAAEPKCISFEDFAVKVMEIKERTGKEKSTLARYQDMLDLWQESGYLFTNEYGGPMNPDNITQYLNRMGDRLQKENPNFPHLNPHAFRHAVASILVANGTDIVTTAAFIGDKPATVSERYAHIIDSAKIRAGDTLSSVIFGDGNK